MRRPCRWSCRDRVLARTGGWLCRPRPGRHRRHRVPARTGVHPDPRARRGGGTDPMAAPCLDTLRPSLEGVVASVIATCDAEGLPNVSMISQVHYVDPERVALSCQFFNKTRRNLLATRRASVQIVDPETMQQHRLALDYEEMLTSSPLFENMKAKLAGIASHHGMEGGVPAAWRRHLSRAGDRAGAGADDPAPYPAPAAARSHPPRLRRPRCLHRPGRASGPRDRRAGGAVRHPPCHGADGRGWRGSALRRGLARLSRLGRGRRGAVRRRRDRGRRRLPLEEPA
ncbi:MAG TPA: pyridoxamine 5'-phosphate oxidase family protein [Rhodovulum sp.]|nr:pyridoxamine 5'-phosphate oxidase family protein [Rhodovulum sp.]